MRDVIGGIVTFNPDIDRLRENIDAIKEQVDEIVVVDNDSNNIHEIMQLSNEYDFELVKLSSNYGIAYALNIILKNAKLKKKNWVLALDQDSVCEKGLVDKYLKYKELPNTGMLTCNIKDRNYIYYNEGSSEKSYSEIKYCITAASFMNVEAYNSGCIYDEKMFIDKVDFDMCLQLREHGFKIYKINFNGLLQEVGDGKTVRIGPFSTVTYNHSPLRRYYMTRNGIYLARKHKEKSLVASIYRELRDMFIVLIFEKDKIEKLKSSLKGFSDGLKMPV